MDNLAPDIQEEILFLPNTVKGRDPITEADIRPHRQNARLEPTTFHVGSSSAAALQKRSRLTKNKQPKRRNR